MVNPVLIVGSGPTGLVLACELLTLGVPCRIIDRLDKPIATSRSFTIHARTLELLDKLDLADEFLARGHKSYWMEYHFQGKEETSGLNFSELDSLYPFCLIINQNETEAILREHLARLGGTIEWNTKLIHLEQDDGQITAILENTQASTQETYQAEWVVGCDGFYSTVRQSLDLPFDGEQFSGEMKMMDVEVSGFDYHDDKIYYFITKEHMLLMTKLPGKNYRVLISDTGQGATTETARADFQRVVDLHFQGRVQLGEPEWATVFKIHRRKADTYQRGRVLLAGDAAHVNSPAGGQGMNVSIQDAFNLAWKLALVMKGQAHSSLIETYEQERVPIAAQMQEGTQYIHSIIMAHGSGIEERIALTKAPDWNRKAVNQVAGISYTYRKPQATTALTAGDRVPDIYYNEHSRFYDLIDRHIPSLVVMLADQSTTQEFETMKALAEQVAATAAVAIRYVIPTGLADELEIDEARTVDTEGAIRDRFFARDHNRIYLMRPDRYIAFEAESGAALLSHVYQYYAKDQLG